jgi:hypothetical protein
MLWAITVVVGGDNKELCTVTIVGLACMQMVQQRKLHLDDGDSIERGAQEFAGYLKRWEACP